MTAPISVVIPTLNAALHLPGCAAALMEGVSAGLIRELVISDGGSADETLKVAEDLGAELVQGPASRGGQLRRGCASTRGAWLLIIHADTQLAPGWSASAAQFLNDPECAGYGMLRFDRGGSFVSAWANLRSGLFRLPYGDQGLLVSRALYDAVGGYADIPLMEDVAIARALGGRLRAAGFTSVTSAQKYRAQGWFRRGARNLWTLARYFLGVSPELLAHAYRR